MSNFRHPSWSLVNSSSFLIISGLGFRSAKINDIVKIFNDPHCPVSISIATFAKKVTFMSGHLNIHLFILYCWMLKMTEIVVLITNC